jgi:hypothetical protein
MTVNTRVIKLFLRGQELSSIPLTDGLKLQIIPSISYLPQCQKHHFAAFIQDKAIVIVWDDDPRHILDRTRHLEQQLMAMIWKGTSVFKEDEASNQGSYIQTSAVARDEDGGIDADDFIEKPRKTVMIQAWLSAVTLVLVTAAIGFGFRQIAIEVKIDRYWMRLAFVAVVPLQIWLALVKSDSHLEDS